MSTLYAAILSPCALADLYKFAMLAVIADFNGFVVMVLTAQPSRRLRQCTSLSVSILAISSLNCESYGVDQDKLVLLGNGILELLLAAESLVNSGVRHVDCGKEECLKKMLF